MPEDDSQLRAGVCVSLTEMMRLPPAANHSATVNHLAFHPSGDFLLTASADSTLKVHPPAPHRHTHNNTTPHNTHTHTHPRTHALFSFTLCTPRHSRKKLPRRRRCKAPATAAAHSPHSLATLTCRALRRSSTSRRARSSTQSTVRRHKHFLQHALSWIILRRLAPRVEFLTPSETELT